MGGQKSPPSPPNLAQSYGQGIKVNLAYLPKELQAEYAYRQQYDPLYIAQQQALQQQYGPTQYAQQLQALQQLDPTGVAVRNALGADVTQYLRQGYLNPQQAAAYAQFGDLASKAAAQGGWTPEQAAAYKALGQSVTSGVLQGTQVDPTTLNEMSQAIRSRQGPYAQGNAQDMAEAVYIGQRAQQLNQQRQGAAQGYLGLQNPAGQAAQGLQQFAQMQTPQAQSLTAGLGYMGSPNPISEMLGIQGVQAPTANQFVNPFAGQQGVQFALSNYQNQLGYNQLNQSQGNPWLAAAGGVIGGVAGGYFGGPAGASAGAGLGMTAGNTLGSYFSDARTKRDIEKIGRVGNLDRVEFRYLRGKARYRGVMAEQVVKEFPNAVTTHDGFLKVNYDAIGIPFEKQCPRCKQFKNIKDYRRIASYSLGSGHYNWCRLCSNAYRRGFYGTEEHRKYHANYYRNNPEKWKGYRLKRDFGMSLAEYNELFTRQAGKCAICSSKQPKRGLFVDHCHKTDQVRGLLCHYCNIGLGVFRDNPDLIERAFQYLTKVEVL